MCRDYGQVKEMMKGGKMVLNWEVEDKVLFFKLSGQTQGYLGLAFSYSNVPEDGFIAGVDDQGEQYVVDLHLDHAGKERYYFYLKSFIFI